jgi:hypothetical protein
VRHGLADQSACEKGEAHSPLKREGGDSVVRFLTVMDQSTHIDFRHFKIVSINDDNQIHDEFSFIHPTFGQPPAEFNSFKRANQNDFQRLIISDDLRWMIDAQDQSKIFLYRSESINGFDKDGRELRGYNANGVNKLWRYVRKLHNFPIAMLRQTNPKSVFAPNLDKFLDYDSVTSEFVIRCLRNCEDEAGEHDLDRRNKESEGAKEDCTRQVRIPRGILSG